MRVRLEAHTGQERGGSRALPRNNRPGFPCVRCLRVRLCLVYRRGRRCIVGLTARFCCVCVSCLLLPPFALQEAIVEAAGVERVYRAMETHVEDPVVQEVACACLSNCLAAPGANLVYLPAGVQVVLVRCQSTCVCGGRASWGLVVAKVLCMLCVFLLGVPVLSAALVAVFDGEHALRSLFFCVCGAACPVHVFPSAARHSRLVSVFASTLTPHCLLCSPPCPATPPTPPLWTTPSAAWQHCAPPLLAAPPSPARMA